MDCDLRAIWPGGRHALARDVVLRQRGGALRRRISRQPVRGLKKEENDAPDTTYALLASAGALATPFISRSAGSAEPIRFGWLVALTGANSAPGVGYNRGVHWAADQLNAKGGVKGRKIEVVTRDTQGDPTKAVNAAVEFASHDKVHAVFGPTNSGEALATTPILSRYKVPNMQQGVLDRLIDPERYPYAFRNAGHQHAMG